MEQPNKRERKAINRARKRAAELSLLADSDPFGGNRCEGKKAKSQEITVENCSQEPTGSTKAGVVEGGQRPTPTEAAESLSANDLRLVRENYKQTRGGFKAIVQLHKLNGRKLSERELAEFLHRQMLGAFNVPNCKGSNWIRFEGGRKPLQIVFVRINCSDAKLLNTHEDAKFIDEYYERRWVDLHKNVLDRRRFWRAVSSTVQSRREMLIRKIKKGGDPLLSMRTSERKAQLLMSLEQMAEAKYPFPTGSFDEKRKGEPVILATKRLYQRVSEKSPIFVLDCEMCKTSIDRLELTRVSMVNEAGDMVMDQLAKPHNKIVDYITHKSGITEQTLKGVIVRLKDVQKQFCAMIPSDAILCGHSLENDLQALQLSHPYCIDTSLLFNFSGRSHIRSGLKALAKIFLNEDIQTSPTDGHCSLQDALATLKLLRLKLEKGIQFGNVALGWNFKEWADANGMTTLGTRIRETTEKGEEEDPNPDSSELPKSNASESVGAEQGQKDLHGLMGEKLVEKEDGAEEGMEARDENNGVTTEEEQMVETGYNGTESESFDFSEAVRIDNAMQKNSKLSDCFDLVNGGKRGKKLLVAVHDANEYFEANNSCKLFDFSNLCPPADGGAVPPSQTLYDRCGRLSSQIINYDFVLAELNCADGTSRKELDVAFEKLVEGVCNNGMLVCILAGGAAKHDGKAIMYQKIHRKKFDTTN